MTAPSEEITWDENATSRFKILERPFRSPGKCSCCGAVDRPVVDFGFNLNRYGAVMLCVTCVSEAGERIGMVRPENHEAETIQTGQSVADYLVQHNLKVVTHEFYDAVTVAFDAFSVDRSVDLSSLSPVDGEDAEGAEQTTVNPLQGELEFDPEDERSKPEFDSEFKL